MCLVASRLSCPLRAVPCRCSFTKRLLLSSAPCSILCQRLPMESRALDTAGSGRGVQGLRHRAGTRQPSDPTCDWTALAPEAVQSPWPASRSWRPHRFWLVVHLKVRDVGLLQRLASSESKALVCAQVCPVGKGNSGEVPGRLSVFPSFCIVSILSYTISIAASASGLATLSFFWSPPKVMGPESIFVLLYLIIYTMAAEDNNVFFFNCCF